MKPPTIVSYSAAREPAILNEKPRRPAPEIEIQARLFNWEFGSRFVTTESTTVEILHFGEWNHEAGPDFKGATIRFDDQPTVRGDLEVDWDARDWERHGHALNPAYEHVALHLFIENPGSAAFARTPENRAIPQAILEIGGASITPITSKPAPVDIPTAASLISIAAEFRLHRKQAAMKTAKSLHGSAAALFHGIASCLGFKDNSIPFLIAAQRVGVRCAIGTSGEALLFGVAGFLEPRSFDDADETTRTYLKPLWDHWWTVRDKFSKLIIPRASWKLSGIRPQNHPHRRLGALAAIAPLVKPLLKASASGDLKKISAYFETLRHPFWTRHWNLSAEALKKDIALIGQDRATDILINAVIPSLPPTQAQNALKSIQGPSPSSRLRRACEWLVGDFRPAVARSAFAQQGLLQLHSDFGHLSAIEACERIRSPHPPHGI